MVIVNRNTIGGHSIKSNEFATIDELDAQAGKPGTALAEANSNLYYRGSAQDARDAFLAAVEKETGIAPLTKDTGEKDDAGEPIFEVIEKPTAYYNRVLKEKGLVDAERPFQHLADQITVTLDAKRREPSAPKVTKVPQKAIDKATAFIAAGRQSEWATRISDMVGRPIAVDTLNDATAFGRLLVEYLKTKEAKEFAAMQ
jgi:hypothetical protein